MSALLQGLQCELTARPFVERLLADFPARNIPQIKWERGGIKFISPFNRQAGRFMYEMLTKWLFPGKRTHLTSFFVADCALEGVSYTVGEGRVEGMEEEENRERLSLFEVELLIGLASSLQAQRILELKGFSTAEKSALIQERLSHLIERRPAHFESDLFELMQQFLLIGGEGFCRLRDARVLSRMIAQFYILRKTVEAETERLPQRRHVIFKVGRSQIHDPFGSRPVLGLLVALNFVKEHETLTRRQLIRSIRSSLPSAVPIEESFLVWTPPSEPIQLLYIEMEKEDKTSFTGEEISALKREFPKDVQGRIEHLLRPLFMPRNAEEIMRGAVTLSSQLRYPRDLPQILIHFDQQSDQSLFFTVIVARIAHPHPLQNVIDSRGMPSSLSLERIKRVGLVRRRFPKEIAIFRCALSQHRFLRHDESIDLYAARSQVVSEVQDLIGEVRDFNGGMLAKHTEALLQLKKEVGPLDRVETLLVENFFYSIYPVEFRSVVPMPLLAAGFRAIQRMAKTGECLVVDESEEGMVIAREEDEEGKGISPLSSDLLVFHVEAFDRSLVGYLCSYPEPERRVAFRDQLLESVLLS